MKALFISYNQALTDPVMDILNKNNIRGFTRWETTHGRGSKTGEPHYGTHAWPAMNSSILAIVEDHKVRPALQALRALDKITQMQGLRAFVWNVEEEM